jgi:hypothetical protein
LKPLEIDETDGSTILRGGCQQEEGSLSSGDALLLLDPELSVVQRRIIGGRLHRPLDGVAADNPLQILSCLPRLGDLRLHYYAAAVVEED